MAGKDFLTNSNIKSRQRFEIVNNSKNADVIGIKTPDGREVRYSSQGNAFVDDPGLAREIHATTGQGGTNDCVVIPIEKSQDKIHRRTFTVPRLPWHDEE
jgi:hypothetical protein